MSTEIGVDNNTDTCDTERHYLEARLVISRNSRITEIHIKFTRSCVSQITFVRTNFVVIMLTIEEMFKVIDSIITFINWLVSNNIYVPCHFVPVKEHS